MSFQHLLLNKDGSNEVREGMFVLSHLITKSPAISAGPDGTTMHNGEHVEVEIVALNGKHYAVAYDRPAEHEEVLQLIKSYHISPVD